MKARPLGGNSITVYSPLFLRIFNICRKIEVFMASSQSLKRTISCTEGVALSIGAVVGVSILVLPGLTAQQAGPAAILSWLIMAFLTFPVVLSLGRLSMILPEAGGLIAYVSAAFGERVGATIGWVLLGSVPIGVPVISLIGAHYFSTLIPLSTAMSAAFGFLMIITSIALNVRGLRIASAIQVAVVSVILLLVVGSVAAALPHVSLAEFTPFMPFGWHSVGVAVVPIFFCFVGWEMITPLAEEFQNPQRDMMKSLLIAAGIISVLYLSVAFVTIGAGAYNTGGDLATFSVLVGKTLGRRGSEFTAVLAVLVAFASIHINITGFSRILFAQARNGYLPNTFAKIHPRFNTPYTSLLLLLGLFSTVLVFYILFQPNLAQLIKWPSVVFVFAYIVTMAAGFKLIPRRDIGWSMSLVAFALCLLILSFSGWTALFPIGLSCAGWFATSSKEEADASGEKNTVNSPW